VGLASTLTRPRVLRLFRRGVLEDGLRLSMVYADQYVDEVVARGLDARREMIEAGTEAYAVPEIPLGLLVGRTAAGPRAVVIVHDESGSLAGALVNDRPAAVAYATRLFERYRSRATDITPALE